MLQRAPSGVKTKNAQKTYKNNNIGYLDSIHPAVAM